MRKICQTDRYFYAVKVPLKLWIGYVNVFIIIIININMTIVIIIKIIINISIFIIFVFVRITISSIVMGLRNSYFALFSTNSLARLLSDSLL